MEEPRVVQVLESAVNNGKFGRNWSFDELVPNERLGKDHFASDVTFANVKLRTSDHTKVCKVVIKKQPREAFIRNMMNTDVQFYVEAIMYNEILPFLEVDRIVEHMFPKCFFAHATLEEDYTEDLLVIEDLRESSYRLSEERLFLDFNHCQLALKKLGRFHGLSYLAKQTKSEEFFKHMSKLKEARWIKEKKDECNQFLSCSMEKGIHQLLEEQENGRILLQFLEKTQDPHEFMTELCKPEEPLAVLCHGDFCRNNIIFKYDGRSPVDVRFFDVATARYASPAIDLSFFLFMNTSAELRRSRWDDLLRVYHDGLRSVAPDCRIPSLEAIRSELVSKAAYGYVLSSFFIPTMIDDGNTELEDLASMKTEEIEELTRSRGGDKGTALVTDVLRDIIKLTCMT